jgi:hypothetical protein
MVVDDRTTATGLLTPDDWIRCIGFDSGDEYLFSDPDLVKSIELYESTPHIYNGTWHGSVDRKSGTGRRMNNIASNGTNQFLTFATGLKSPSISLTLARISSPGMFAEARKWQLGE